MKVGTYHNLEILRFTSVGIYLGNENKQEILLPTKFVKNSFKVGQELKVFVYLDNENRPIATLLEPYTTVCHFAFLEVMELTDFGAFLDWGLEKQLLLPFANQKQKVKPGEHHLVYVYEDKKTNRLVASAKWENFINKNTSNIELHQEVDLLILGSSELGINCIVNNEYRGLAFHNENFKKVESGDQLKGYVKNIRPDGKLDVLFEKPGIDSQNNHAEKILRILKVNGGVLHLHDKSAPSDIYNALQISKKAFKRAIGKLYKDKLVSIENQKVTLIEKY